MNVSRKQLFLFLKTVAAIILIAAVSYRFGKLLGDEQARDKLFSADLPPLFLAGFLYLAAHLIWGTFWVQLLWGLKANVTWREGISAYFISQFGKYVPGKAWVILLRIGLLKKTGTPKTVIGVTATYETLTTMAAGAVFAAALLPWAGLPIENYTGGWPILWLIAGLPLALGAINRVAARVVLKKRGPDSPPLPSPSIRLLTQGLIQATFGWLLLGASLWLVVRSLSEEIRPFAWYDYLQDLSAVGLSYVIGFVVVFAPGGLGARELVLQQVLTLQFKPFLGVQAAPFAAIVAIILRLVWTLFEVVIGLLLLALSRHTPAVAPGPDLVISGSEREA